MRQRLVVLLPVRNGEGDLPEFFAALRPFADAVVALDDGSTDRTSELLHGESLVQVVLTNPRRESYAGWDDSENRNRLLAAAADLEPAWILSLDADERLDPEDGAALRRFLDDEALPGCAYGFRVYRMWDDHQHFSKAGLWVYRLFAWEPEQRFPEQRLHFVPIPSSIPRILWVRTTLRIQHLASLTADRRSARFRKYQEADPDNAFQHSYRDLLAEPETPLTWESRTPEMPVLLLTETEAEADLATPALSAIIISRNDEETIARTVASVVEQECPWPFEVIVVTSGTDRTAAIVRDRFPDVIVVQLAKPALPGEARNAGLEVAKGDYISFPGSHVELPQGSLAARLQAHDQGYAMITGSALNGTTTLAGWASYFLDHSGSLPGRPSAELKGAPSHCSYSREALLRVGGFREDRRTGEDTIVNQQLTKLGYRAFRSQDVTFIHHSPCATPWRLAKHHFGRGRGFGQILLDRKRLSGGLVSRRRIRSLATNQVPRRLDRTRGNVESWGGPELHRRFGEVERLVAVGAASAWLGTMYEILRPGKQKIFVQFGKPTLTLLIAGLDRWSGKKIGGRADVLMLARVDILTRRVRIVGIPRDLLVEIPGSGPGRINGAYHLGAWRDLDDPESGPLLLRRTVEHAFDVAIDDHVVFDFDGFMGLIDVMGGIQIDVPKEILDTQTWIEDDGTVLGKLHFSRGRQQMDGDTALKYARVRYLDSDGARGNRHMAIGLAIVERARSIRSPRQIRACWIAVHETVQTSLGLRRKVMLVWAALTIPRERIDTGRLGRALLQPGETARKHFVWTGDRDEISRFVQDHLETRNPDEFGRPLDR